MENKHMLHSSCLMWFPSYSWTMTLSRRARRTIQPFSSCLIRIRSSLACVSIDSSFPHSTDRHERKCHNCSFGRARMMKTVSIAPFCTSMCPQLDPDITLVETKLLFAICVTVGFLGYTACNKVDETPPCINRYKGHGRGQPLEGVNVRRSKLLGERPK